MRKSEEAHLIDSKALVDSDPRPKYRAGTHLASPRLGGSYYHHGLYIGNYEVIHHSGWARALEKGAICKTSLEEFCAGNDLYVIKYSNKRHWKSIVKSANEALKNADAPEWQYSLASKNCEHFVTGCVTGSPHSLQIQTIAKIVLGPVIGTIYHFFVADRPEYEMIKV